MTKEEFAALLDGREYGSEITSDEEKHARQCRLLVVFGASDDLIEFRGVLSDESNGYDGGTAYVNRQTGKLLPDLEEEESDVEVLEKYGLLEIAQTQHKDCIRIDAHWCRNDSAYSWEIETKEPHATFDIMEDGEKFCRGIVVQL